MTAVNGEWFFKITIKLQINTKLIGLIFILLLLRKIFGDNEMYNYCNYDIL